MHVSDVTPAVLFSVLQNKGTLPSFKCTVIFDPAHSQTMVIYSGYLHVTCTAMPHWQPVIRSV